MPLPTSLEKAFVLDSPGEYEVHDVMVTGVRTFRDNEQGAARGMSTSFVYELDGIYTAHLGEVGHLLDQDTIREIGHVDVVCLGIGPQLSAAHAAEIVSQLDAHMVVPMPLTEAAAQARGRPRQVPQGDERDRRPAGPQPEGHHLDGPQRDRGRAPGAARPLLVPAGRRAQAVRPRARASRTSSDHARVEAPDAQPGGGFVQSLLRGVERA